MSDKKPDPLNKKVKPIEVKHKAPASQSKRTGEESLNKKTSGEERGKLVSNTKKKPEFNSVVLPKNKTSKPHKQSISRASAILLALITTLTASTIGWVGPIIFSNNAKKDLHNTVAQLETQISTQTNEISALRSALSSQTKTLQSAQGTADQQRQNLQTEIRDLLNKEPNIAPIDDEHIQNLFTPSLAELSATINTRIDVLESGLSKDETINTEGSSALVDRLMTLEAERETLVQISTQIASLQERVDILSAQNVSPQTGQVSQSAFPEPETEAITLPEQTNEESIDREAILQVLIESFPREKMFEAVHAQNTIASKKPSWLQRTLSKHVKVKDDNAPAPIATILNAERAIKEERIQDALDEIAKLNPPVRSIAADWVSSAKKAMKSLDSVTP